MEIIYCFEVRLTRMVSGHVSVASCTESTAQQVGRLSTSIQNSLHEVALRVMWTMDQYYVCSEIIPESVFNFRIQ